MNQRKWIMYFIEWQEQPPKRDQFIPHMHRLKTDTLTVICLWTAHCVVTFLVKSQAHGVKKGRGQVSQSTIEVIAVYYRAHTLCRHDSKNGEYSLGCLVYTKQIYYGVTPSPTQKKQHQIQITLFAPVTNVHFHLL